MAGMGAVVMTSLALAVPTGRWRARLFAILHKPEPGNRAARYANYLLATLILANAIAVALESVVAIRSKTGEAFWWFEALSTALFAVEYVSRLWVCVEQGHLSHPIRGRLRYALQPLPLLDLLVVLTYWSAFDLRFLRVFRLVRLLKVLRLYEFEAALERMLRSLRRRRELLIVAVVLMAVCVYASAALLYQLERDQQPDVFSSIPAAFWWAVMTFTTIGYGDAAPVTAAGKLCTGLVVLFGVGIFALPSAIVTAAIIEASASPEGHGDGGHAASEAP